MQRLRAARELEKAEAAFHEEVRLLAPPLLSSPLLSSPLLSPSLSSLLAPAAIPKSRPVSDTQKRRLVAELQEERATHARLLTQERERLQMELKVAREADAKTATALREDTERALAESARRQQVELQSLREQLAIEKESWEEMFLRRQQMNLKEKVRLGLALLTLLGGSHA